MKFGIRGAIAATLVTSIVLGSVLPREVRADSEAIPIVTTLAPETREQSVKKAMLMTQMKENAKDNWEDKQNKVETTRIEAEAAQLQHDKAKFLVNEQRKEQLKKQIAGNVTDAVGNAESTAQAEVTRMQKKVDQLRAQVKSLKAKVKKLKSSKEKGTSKYTDYAIGSAGRSEWKSFEYHKMASGRSTFCTSSGQYALQQKAYTGKYGIRMVGDRYCIAVASRFGKKVGTKIDVYLDTGVVLKCIMGDQKSDADTDYTHSYHEADGSYVEFIADRQAISPRARKFGNFGALSALSGKVTKLRVYK